MQHNEKLRNLEAPSSNSCGEIPLAAAEGALALVRRCRVRKGIDGREFWLAIAYVLNHYDPEIIKKVIDPFSGLPGRLKYPLEIADVKAACEREMTTVFAVRAAAYATSTEQQATAAREERLREEQDRLAERARTLPSWGPIMARLMPKANASMAEIYKASRMGTFADGVLEIIVPADAISDHGFGANAVYFIKQLFPVVKEIAIVADKRNEAAA
jgi:hypothetical protein